MAVDRNENLLPDGQDTVIYINPALIQSLADLSAEKRQNFQELLAAAQDGSLDAACRLAQNYCRGSGGAPRDEEKGFYWFAKAAEAGAIAAQHGLGLCYARGIGTERDAEKAVRLFSAAAEQEYPPSICELGLCYELGTGVEMDKARAAEL